MSEVRSFEQEVAGKKLIVEVGKLAPQAHGACTVRYGDTVVLATVVQAVAPREGIDYFPLLVDYEERLYAAGKIKGSRFIKREGRPTDEATLTARLIDRSLRPLFKDTERRDVQVVVTVLSVDQENDADVPALLGASLALAMSPVAWNGPVGAVRVGRVGGEWVLNPSYEARTKSDLDVYVSATETEIVMLEAGATQVAEADIAEAIAFGHKHIGKLFPFLQQVIQACAVPKQPEPELSAEEAKAEAKLKAKVESYLDGKFGPLFQTKSKVDYQAVLNGISNGLDEALKADNEISKESRAQGLEMIEYYLDLAARHLVLEQGRRVDGRGIDEVRPLSAEVGVLPRTHGSGLFRRGETQVLSVVTLGSPGMEQTLDGMEEDSKKRFMHHYNFPGFSVGEVKPVRSPGRREIGHGALAEKALMPIIPQDRALFPYTIRVVSEVLSSNGSSSQASICGSSLALMDAGVPIAAPVAGIAMGLITDPKDKSRYAILTDIQGVEDHAGDMDFKVAGTAQGITAVQLDIKLGGVSQQVVEETLSRARVARVKILEVMGQALPAPRPELSQYAPRIVSFHIPVDRIRDVIGPGGKIINEIIDATGVTIDIEDDGLVMVTSVSAEASTKAVDWIKTLTREVVVGETFEGKVTRLMNFGAFVEILPRQEGLVHVSELSWDYVTNVSDVVKIGDIISVKVVEIDEQGRINLSHRQTQPRPDAFPSEPPRGYAAGRESGPPPRNHIGTHG
ncbi:MAG: polyribonucleotide nucleotidyltransferase, partial [Candidatus Veblenbacteria bacterium]|nr:polyribonucleotide nucleotidyltransferase [Candidatus Veblenbacteria bacterium]